MLCPVCRLFLYYVEDRELLEMVAAHAKVCSEPAGLVAGAPLSDHMPFGDVASESIGTRQFV